MPLLSFQFIIYLLYSSTGIKITAHQNHVTIYPNPGNSILNISDIDYQAEIKAFDILGNVVLKNEKLSTQNSSAQIDISNLQNGVYFLQVGNNKQKFIKQ